MSGDDKTVEGLRTSIQEVLELASRLDERMNLCLENQRTMHARFERFQDWAQKNSDQQNELAQRVSVLESKNGNKYSKLEEEVQTLREKLITTTHKITQLELGQQNYQSTVKTYTEMVLRIVWTVITAYVLVRMGLSNGPIPGL